MFYALGSVEVSAMPYVATILTLFTACVLVLVTAALLDSDSEMPLVRLAQRARISGLRLGRMLRRQGVTVRDYAGTLSAATLQRQALACRQCSQTQLCDRALAGNGGPNSHTRFTFCPNQPAIARYLDPRSHISGACFSR